MTTPEAVLFLTLFVLAVVVLIWALVPPLFHCLGWSEVDSIEDPTPPLRRMERPEYRDFDAQLRALGFQALGGYRKTLRYALLHWVKRFQARVYLAPDRRSYAKILWLNVLDLPRPKFFTVLTNGEALETSSTFEDVRVDRNGYHRRGRVTNDLRELFTLHQEWVDSWTSAAAAPLTFQGLADVVEADVGVERRELAATTSTSAYLLLIYLFLFGGVGYFVAQLLDGQSYAVAAGIFAGGLGVLFLHLLLLFSARAHRQAELARAKAPSAEV